MYSEQYYDHKTGKLVDMPIAGTVTKRQVNRWMGYGRYFGCSHVPKGIHAIFYMPEHGMIRVNGCKLYRVI